MEWIGPILVVFSIGTAPLLLVVALVYYSLKRHAEARDREVVAALSRQQEALVAAVREVVNERIPAPIPAPVPAPAAAAAPASKISEDKLMVIGAVLACHFGKRVKVRSARRVIVGGVANVWSQQGRAAVQASHSGYR